jgi:uncharacterized membrane protein YidH (DUF202 family)
VVRTRRPREPTARGALIGAGVAIVALVVVALLVPMSGRSWDVWGAAFLGPALFLATLPALARQARRERQPKVFSFLVLALVAKFSFSILRYYHAFYVFDKGDARQYNGQGREIAARFVAGDFHTGLGNLLDSNFIRFFTGVIYTPIRPSTLSAFFIYAWLAFWGTYFFYRAFVLAVPEGDRWRYARWLFFMPSILFWPSSIGKESWMIFALGIAAFGAAKTLSGRFVPGIVITGIGIGLAALVRAPIGILMGIGLVIAFVLRRLHRRDRRHHRDRQDRQTTSTLARVGAALVLVGVGVGLLVMMKGYLVRSGFAEPDLDTVIEVSRQQTSQGGSEFEPTTINDPISFAVGSVTVLFRPFLPEAHTPEAIVTSLEASVLLLFCLVRFRSFVASARNARRIPYVLVAMIYVTGSILALSPVANFGIIARQRVLLYPMLFVFMCVLPPEVSARRARTRAVQAGEARPLVGSRT